MTDAGSREPPRSARVATRRSGRRLPSAQDRVRRPACADRACRGRDHARAHAHRVWRWLLILATAATIFLCINQQFTLRFFVGYTQLNTEYFYLLIVLHAALHVPDLSGEQLRPARPRALVRRRPVPRHGGRRGLPDGQRAQGGRARLGVRRRADAGDRGGLRSVGAPDGGAAPHRRLEPAAERAAVHGLPAVCRRSAGSGRCAASSRRSSRPPPITRCPTRACSASRSRRSPIR